MVFGMRWPCALVAIVLAGACDAAGPSNDVHCIESFEVPYPDTRLDVLVMVDVSPAMVGREAVLEQNLDRLAADLAAGASDLRIGVVSADATDPDLRARITSASELTAAAALPPDSPHAARPFAKLGPALADDFFRDGILLALFLLMGQDDCSSRDYTLAIDDPLACAQAGVWCEQGAVDGDPDAYTGCFARPASDLLDPETVASAVVSARPLIRVAMASPPSEPFTVDEAGLVPICGASTPAVRLQRFGFFAGASWLSSCDDDWSNLVPPPLNVDNAEPCLFRGAGARPDTIDCHVFEYGRNGSTTELPRCGDGVTGTCWAVEEDRLQCFGGWRLDLRGEDPARARAASVRCETICDPTTGLAGTPTR
jgi:hypothetical protein